MTRDGLILGGPGVRMVRFKCRLELSQYSAIATIDHVVIIISFSTVCGGRGYIY